MSGLDDPALVAAEYATDERLAARIAGHALGSGPDARAGAFDAIAAAAPRRVLEVGCGQGWLAERVLNELSAGVVALDQSAHMVELTRARGVDAVVGDVQQLPFADASFDLVAAAWMLYHVADLDRALTEIARVLEPGGRLVAVTNANEHLRELYELVGLERPALPFASDAAETLLGRHFGHVTRSDAYGWSIFPTRAAAQDYVDASLAMFGGRKLPATTEEPLRVRRAPTVFVAQKAVA